MDVKLVGVELVKERRELPLDHPAYRLPQDLTTEAARLAAQLNAKTPIWQDYVVVYLELEHGIKLKLMEELVEGMVHHVTEHGIRSRYVRVEGVRVEVDQACP